MEKELYVYPQIELITFMLSDVIRTSGKDDDGDMGEWDEQ